MESQNVMTSDCYETILQTMAEGLFMVDRERKVIFYNNALEELTGLSSAELLGSRCGDFMYCACSNDEKCDVFNTKAVKNFECQLRHKDGHRIPVLKNAKVMHNKAGQVMGVIETLTDISRLKDVEKKLDRYKLKDASKNKYERIVGKSDKMQELFGLLKMASDSNASILLLGETGTGKELVAEAIHQRSERKNKPLIKVNCSALTDSLLESELFGHVKGSFTGAIKDKIGRFEMADQGTLFLDEISEISPLLQLKLLRFLQEKEFERVGESVTRKSNVRVISASNKDLLTLVQKGMFREDLYYRLKVFPIHLPALRERKEDIGLLIDHFISEFNLDTGKEISGITESAVSMLMDHNWPGNIRELENAIEHAFVIRKSGLIEPLDLPLEIRQTAIIPKIISTPQETLAQIPPGPPRYYRARPQVTPEVLRELLERFKWKKSEVANYLEINRTTLWRLMKKYNIR